MVSGNNDELLKVRLIKVIGPKVKVHWIGYREKYDELKRKEHG